MEYLLCIFFGMFIQWAFTTHFFVTSAKDEDNDGMGF